MDIERAKKLELECNQLLSEVTNLKNEVLVSIHDRLKI